MLDQDACYKIVKAHDARFDGLFFTCVTSTGIYCRTTCAAKVPKRENCLFCKTAAEAEALGFRPCMTCRPELAPGEAVDAEMDGVVDKAARILRSGQQTSISSIAQHLSVSERHLRRIFEERYATTPLQYRTTYRLLLAKSLLTDTALPVSQVAQACGFSSVRRFEEAFKQQYRMPASRLRKRMGKTHVDELACGSFTLTLGYRKPYCYDLLLDFLQPRAIEGVEDVCNGTYRRSVRIENPQGEKRQGWIAVEDAPEKSSIRLTISESLVPNTQEVVAKTRLLFDVDSDPMRIAQALEDFYKATPGVPCIEGARLPCSFDGFEMAVRAILGQQITVRAANTLAGRVVAKFGECIDTPFEKICALFPKPDAFCQEEAAQRLGEIGVIRQRAEAICALARMLVNGEIELSPGANVEETEGKLLGIKGIGKWTAQYILMRALAYPDAFPSTDLGVKLAFPDMTSGKLEKRSEAWRPYRSYAVMSIWSAPHE